MPLIYLISVTLLARHCVHGAQQVQALLVVVARGLVLNVVDAADYALILARVQNFAALLVHLVDALTLLVHIVGLGNLLLFLLLRFLDVLTLHGHLFVHFLDEFQVQFGEGLSVLLWPSRTLDLFVQTLEFVGVFRQHFGDGRLVGGGNLLFGYFGYEWNRVLVEGQRVGTQQRAGQFGLMRDLCLCVLYHIVARVYHVWRKLAVDHRRYDGRLLAYERGAELVDFVRNFAHNLVLERLVQNGQLILELARCAHHGRIRRAMLIALAELTWNVGPRVIRIEIDGTVFENGHRGRGLDDLTLFVPIFRLCAHFEHLLLVEAGPPLDDLLLFLQIVQILLILYLHFRVVALDWVHWREPVRLGGAIQHIRLGGTLKLLNPLLFVDCVRVQLLWVVRRSLNAVQSVGVAQQSLGLVLGGSAGLRLWVGFWVVLGLAHRGLARLVFGASLVLLSLPDLALWGSAGPNVGCWCDLLGGLLDDFFNYLLDGLLNDLGLLRFSHFIWIGVSVGGLDLRVQALGRLRGLPCVLSPLGVSLV